MEFIIVALILLILLIMFERIERFDDVGPVKIFRTDNLKGLMIDTRQPGLMEQRYSYDDRKVCCTPPVIPDVARLRELPLQLRNWYSATVPYDSKRPVYPYRISGYDPNIFLPAEQADRSKISIEKYMAAGYWNMK